LYSKSKSSEIKQAFWTAFGQYMALQPTADGAKVNWINYKTGFKHLKFKMDAVNRSASIAIVITHPDPGIQVLMFDQFRELEKVLFRHLEENWEWQLNVLDDNSKIVSTIKKELKNVSIYQHEDWPTLISFFKQRIVALDAFWSVAQYSFEAFL
jgi:hypothetical protein